MDITEEQMPPAAPSLVVEKGPRPRVVPDTGPRPDMVNPEHADQEEPSVDPISEIDRDGQDPVEDEVVN